MPGTRKREGMRKGGGEREREKRGREGRRKRGKEGGKEISYCGKW